MTRSPVERMVAVDTTCSGSGMVVVGGSVSSVVGTVASVVGASVASCAGALLPLDIWNCRYSTAALAISRAMISTVSTATRPVFFFGFMDVLLCYAALSRAWGSRSCFC